MQADSDQFIGKTLQNFKFMKLLGKGAYGEVYKCEDLRDKSIVAIKAISMKKIQLNPQVEKSIKQEIQILKKCNNPNVIKFVHQFIAERYQMIVVEYCNGGDLQMYLEKKDKLPQEQATRFLKQILNGFKGLHQIQTTHRDFKLSNVLLHNGQCKIGDLGMAKQIIQTAVGTLVGTLYNMAPEILQGQPYGFKADIWSIGVSYYQMIYGIYPFIGGMNVPALLKIIQNQKTPDFDDVKITQNTRSFIQKCLTIDPKQRISWQQIYNHPYFLKDNFRVLEKDIFRVLQKGEYSFEKAVQIFKEQNDWHDCLDRAAKKGPELFNKYMNGYIKWTIEAGNFLAAAEAYAHYGMPLIPQDYPKYKILTLQVLVQCQQKEIALLRKALYQFCNLLTKSTQKNNPMLLQYCRFLTAAHLANLKFIYKERPMCSELYMYVTVSLLRYCDLIKIDKLFYEAGMACKNNLNSLRFYEAGIEYQKNVNNQQFSNLYELAFVLLNRYLDINQLIADPDNPLIRENDSFKLSDIPSPYQVNIPMKNMIDESQKTKIKDWLLQIGTNHKFGSNQSLPLRNCQNCRKKIHDSAIKCPHCSNRSQVCILTGLPVNQSNGKKCRNCGQLGRKDAWNTYLSCFDKCPFCGKHP